MVSVETVGVHGVHDGAGETAYTVETLPLLSKRGSRLSDTLTTPFSFCGGL